MISLCRESLSCNKFGALTDWVAPLSLKSIIILRDFEPIVTLLSYTELRLFVHSLDGGLACVVTLMERKS